MKRKPRWIHKQALLLLHQESLAIFGGSSGIRDEGLLDSALARPQQLQNYRPSCSLADLAASYGFGLAKNHAFVDGNKRVAFLAIGLFLAENNSALAVGQAEAVHIIRMLAAGEMGEAELSAWVGQHLSPS
ncbi:MAG TPA: type II toxin-antitoxin system death-on-curing family toxin [Terriglobales bacterium]|jgi:death-on-curing protein